MSSGIALPVSNPNIPGGLLHSSTFLRLLRANGRDVALLSFAR